MYNLIYEFISNNIFNQDLAIYSKFISIALCFLVVGAIVKFVVWLFKVCANIITWGNL